MAPSIPSLDVGDRINLIALILGVLLSLLSITIAISTCQRTKYTPRPATAIEPWYEGNEELMVVFAINHRRSARSKNTPTNSPAVDQNASSGMRFRRIEPSSEE